MKILLIITLVLSSAFSGFSQTCNSKVKLVQTISTMVEKPSVFLSNKLLYIIHPMLKKENVVEQYSDVVIAGKTCKRFLVSSSFSRNDYSCMYYRLGYIIPHHNTTALFYIDQAKSSPITAFEGDVKKLESVFKYMIETVEFREYNK